VGRIKGRLKKAARELEKDAVIVHLRDGSRQIFTDTEAWAAMFLAQMALFRGESKRSEVLDAVHQATPESKATFEERFGPIAMTARLIAADYQGGWAEVFTLLEDSTVERIVHEGGSEEAERIRLEAQQGGTP
jgi:Zn/Cd-binding protein ZinT